MINFEPRLEPNSHTMPSEPLLSLMKLTKETQHTVSPYSFRKSYARAKQVLAKSKWKRLARKIGHNEEDKQISRNWLAESLFVSSLN